MTPRDHERLLELRVLYFAAQWYRKGCSDQDLVEAVSDLLNYRGGIDVLLTMCEEELFHLGDSDQAALEKAEAPGWVERTMADVRSGDTIRMVGREETRREVAGALHVPWHVADPSAAGSAEQARDIQYNPHRYQQRWSEIRLAFIDGGKYSFDPMMNVEIWLSPSEVAAIEMIGWEHRIGLATRNADEN